MAQDSRSENGKRNGAASAAEQQELVRLLCRALMRLAVAAQGIDASLDTMLSDLRQLLRRELSGPEQLAELIDAIDARIKHVDDERDHRTEGLHRNLLQLATQLLEARPASAVSGELKKFQKNLKRQIADGHDVAMLSRLSDLQAQVLADGTEPRAGLLSRLFGGGRAASPRSELAAVALPSAPGEVEAQSPPPAGAEPEVAPSARVAPEPQPQIAVEHAIESQDSSAELELEDTTTPAPETALVPSIAGEEPPFTRISAAVCQVLNELLRRIEPPPQATENYRHASAQIAKGLNWYELVSTLEEVSQIVLAALDRGEGEFQQFLLGLNERLAEAHQTLQRSRQHETARRQADSSLNESVRLEVAQIQTQVAVATELDQLKKEVSVRLEAVVNAMDQHQNSEQTRQHELELQLDTLTERMREMEMQSAAIEQRMIEQRRLALLDTLTQLPNRQAYDERLAHEFQRWQRYHRPLTLAVCDIDNFKSINDNYGHLAGDKVLRIIAKTLRTRLRKADFIARYGGEEFVVLMPETDAAEALHALDNIRVAVANCPFHFREQPVTITVSVGLAEFTEGAEPDAVFERADSALYRAKQAGRNRCLLDAPATPV